MGERFIIEYIWIGGENEFRSKTRVIMLSSCQSSLKLSDVPDWNYDGSSTKQAKGIDSEIIIKPKAIFRNPFDTLFFARPYRGYSCSYLVLCDTYLPDGSVLYNNTRVEANNLFNKKLVVSKIIYYAIIIFNPI